MTIHSDQFKLTVEDYHKMAEVGIIKDTDRVELINGKIIPMSPVKSSHASMVDDLLELLVLELHGKAIIKGQNPIEVAVDSEPEPDVVIAHFTKNRYRFNHPKPKDIYVIIEVADSTLKYDRETKALLYAHANITEYWIINLIDKQIEIHRQPKNGEYHFKQISSEDGEIKCEAIGLTLQYSQIFPAI